MDITSAAIATLISALTAATITLLLARRNRVQNFDSQLDEILKIGIQHPYLESAAFTGSWRPDYDPGDEKFLHYELYCTLLFNYLSRVADFYKCNEKNIENYVGIKAWVRLHEKYWKNPPDKFENIDGYDPDFVKLVDRYLGTGKT